MPFKKGETPKGAKVFKPGQSGNPAGPKPGQKRSTIVRQLLSITTKEINPLSGKEEVLTQEELITLARIKEAKGDGGYMSYKVLMDSGYGAPKQEIEHSGEVEIGFDIGKISDADLQTILTITQKAKNANG